MSKIDEKISQKEKAIVAEFRKEPRNKIFVDFETLVLSAQRETNEANIKNTLIEAIELYISGKIKNERHLQVVDGALVICHRLADLCFQSKNIY